MIEIVRASREDIALIVPLFDGYRQFYKRSSDLEGAREFLTAHFDQDTSVIFLAFCIEHDGIRRACGFAQLFPSFSSGSMKRLWILNDLFVVPEVRHQGAGRALLERAREFAAETKARGLTLKTGVGNHPAQALYEAAGWTREEQFCSYNLYF